MPMPEALMPLPDPVELPPGTSGAQLRLTDACPERLRGLLLGGALLLSESRWSNPGGSDARDHAATAQHTGARRLIAAGIDFTDLLPSRAALDEAQATEALVTQHPRGDGAPFMLRHTLIQITGTPLLLSLITGSGSLVDLERSQPASSAVAGLLQRYPVGLLYVTELSRFGRVPWPLREVVYALEELTARLGSAPWLGAGTDMDGDRRHRPVALEEVTHQTGYRLFAQAQRAEAEADTTVRRTRDAARTRALEHPTMSDGRAAYFGAGTVYPGLAVVRTLSDRGRRGEAIVFRDEPASRPDAGQISGLLPQQFDDRGRPVDHAGIVRWMLHHLGTPGWGDHEVAAEAERRRFSYDALRRLHGQNAAFHAGGAPDHKLMALLLRHLEEYRTGVLNVALGDRLEPVTITGTGRWLDEADYQRLLHRRQRTTRGRQHARLFTGMPVLVDGQPGRLQASRRRRDGTVTYVVLDPDHGRQRLGSRDHPIPPLPERVVLQQLFTVLADRQATFTPPDTDLPQEDERLTTEQATLRRKITELTHRQRLRMDEIDPASRSRPGSSAIAELHQRFDATAVELSLLRDQVRHLEARRVSLQEDPNLGGLPVGDLWSLAAVATGREPPPPLRLAVQGAIRGFLISRPAGGSGRDCDRSPRFAFTLTVHDRAVGTREVPVDGDYPTWGERQADRRVHGVLAAMRNGQPPLRQGLCISDWRPRLRVALGTRGPARALVILEPELLRMAMAVCHPPAAEPSTDGALCGPPLNDEAVSALAAETGWPEPLLVRLRQLHTNQDQAIAMWLHFRAPATAALYAAGRRQRRLMLTTAQRFLLGTSRTAIDWTRHADDSVALRPCAYCDRRRTTLIRLRESTGGVCRSCRRDRCGVTWPATYDTYLELGQ